MSAPCGCSGDETGQLVTVCHYHRVVAERDELRAELAAYKKAKAEDDQLRDELTNEVNRNE